MAGQRFTVNSRNYDLSLRRSWECEFISRNDDSIILLGVFEEDVSHPDLGLIAKGTTSRETFYLNRWYNHFIFHEPDGTFRNHYFNICIPPTVGEGLLDYVDLDIDIVIWPDGKIVTLDMDECESNALTFGYPADVHQTALDTLALITKNQGFP